MASKKEFFFNNLFEKTHGKAFNFVKSLSNNEHIASDVTQAAFIKIWTSIDTYMEHPNAEALVFVTIKNMFLDEMRKINRLNTILYSIEDKKLTTNDLNTATTTESDYLENELFEIINKSLNKLPERIKEVYKNYLFKDIPIKEIAMDMQLSVSTVHSDINIAKRFLQNQLQDFKL